MEQDATGQQEPVGVRERNRQALRRKLSDTATAMFLEQGFDAVRVSDVARACGVSTKTVWNHFPTKEALLLDRGERLATALRTAAAERTDVLEVVVTSIDTEIDQLDADDQDDGPDGGVLRSVQAFVRLVEANPGLRAAAADRFEQLVRLAADALAAQTGTPAQSPQNQILAGALISLWRLHLSALLHAGDRSLPPAQLRDHVRREVHAGAELVAVLVREAARRPDVGG
ncbi:TetR family transcriptional regulator [Modestobacter sp. I12A-02628]|uniref:TetR/AcrR family transcriptional regulator n=1 Tax=Goekera deserti TaxID=2497753 RepID=A0A7K3WBP0_9ACTN|nr:TetR/AcrR family transcriptional regulator [Goekera deserti]MPQ97400.1 TetR family transcriptional regulator [Goekera deserti]NDI47999.1 TetR family transcriptional regulator [Goekera deserti]NEL53747.1 TetR/AcrR family transcriptional regulator [Goekera deserti]